MLITNRMRRPFFVPRIKDKQGNISKVIKINGGKYAEIDNDLWKQVSKLPAVKALINQRCLDIKPGRGKEVDEEDLENPETKKAPDDLQPGANDERLELDSTTTVVDLDAPAGGTKKAKAAAKKDAKPAAKKRGRPAKKAD